MPKGSIFKAGFGGALSLLSVLNLAFGWFKSFDWLQKNAAPLWELLVKPTTEYTLVTLGLILSGAGFWEIYQYKRKPNDEPPAAPPSPPANVATTHGSQSPINTAQGDIHQHFYSPPPAGIRAHNSRNLQISNNYIEDAPSGIDAEGLVDSDITRNEIRAIASSVWPVSSITPPAQVKQEPEPQLRYLEWQPAGRTSLPTRWPNLTQTPSWIVIKNGQVTPSETAQNVTARLEFVNSQKTKLLVVPEAVWWEFGGKTAKGNERVPGPVHSINIDGGDDQAFVFFAQDEQSRLIPYKNANEPLEVLEYDGWTVRLIVASDNLWGFEGTIGFIQTSKSFSHIPFCTQRRVMPRLRGPGMLQTASPNERQGDCQSPACGDPDTDETASGANTIRLEGDYELDLILEIFHSAQNVHGIVARLHNRLTTNLKCCDLVMSDVRSFDEAKRFYRDSLGFRQIRILREDCASGFETGNAWLIRVENGHLEAGRSVGNAIIPWPTGDKSVNRRWRLFLSHSADGILVTHVQVDIDWTLGLDTIRMQTVTERKATEARDGRKPGRAGGRPGTATPSSE